MRPKSSETCRGNCPGTSRLRGWGRWRVSCSCKEGRGSKELRLVWSPAHGSEHSWSLLSLSWILLPPDILLYSHPYLHPFFSCQSQIFFLDLCGFSSRAFLYLGPGHALCHAALQNALEVCSLAYSPVSPVTVVTTLRPCQRPIEDLKINKKWMKGMGRRIYNWLRSKHHFSAHSQLPEQPQSPGEGGRWGHGEGMRERREEGSDLGWVRHWSYLISSRSRSSPHRPGNQSSKAFFPQGHTARNTARARVSNQRCTLTVHGWICQGKGEN